MMRARIPGAKAVSSVGIAFAFLLAGCTPAIVRAANKGQTDRVRELLAQGADPNAVPSAGTMCCGSALFVASRAGNVEMAKLLLDKGADPNQRNFDLLPPTNAMYDLTALMAASLTGQDAIVEALLKKGAKVDAATPQGYTAMSMAKLRNYASTIQLLQQWQEKEHPSAPAIAAPSPAAQAPAAPEPWYGK